MDQKATSFNQYHSVQATEHPSNRNIGGPPILAKPSLKLQRQVMWSSHEIRRPFMISTHHDNLLREKKLQLHHNVIDLSGEDSSVTIISKKDQISVLRTIQFLQVVTLLENIT